MAGDVASGPGARSSPGSAFRERDDLTQSSEHSLSGKKVSGVFRVSKDSASLRGFFKIITSLRYNLHTIKFTLLK